MAEAAARERDIRLAAIALLDASGAFDLVAHYSMPEERGQPAGAARAAVVQPVNGVESLEWDDVTTAEPLCKMTFNVVVMARDDDPQTRDDMADRLLSVVRNALNGQSLAGLTLPFTTIARNHVWLPEKPPERQIRIVVEASYLAPSFTDFNTDE